MKAKKPERTYELVPAGNHVARLYQIVHIGTNSFEYKGEMKKSDKVRLTFELCNERKAFKEGEEPKPFSISREFGLTMGKKSNLRPFVEGFIGTSLDDEEAYGFDLDDLIGMACLLNVVHAEVGDKVYSNIRGASPLPKGMDAPELFNESKIIDVDTAPFEEIEALPEFIRDKMKSSEEYQARVNPPESESLAKKNRPNVIKKELEYPHEDIDTDSVPF
jgi:hypothetical protein